MRVTVKGARAFCLWMLAAFVVYMCFIGVKMAHAVNALDQVPKLISRSTPADSAFVRGDTLYMNQMSVSLAAVLKAVAVQTDTVRGASTIVGIVDDTLIVDTDSTGSDVTIRFGRWGAGLRWHRDSDALQFSNDFATWTAIGSGSGSSTTNADSLGHKVARVRPLTDGYVLKYDSDGDSLYLSADATGAAGDSNAIVYETDRLGMYSDTGLYLGDVGDSTMLWYDLTEDNIKAYVILYYVDDISDSALMSKYWIESTIGDSLEANGFLTGLNSSNGISGGASMNIVSIQLDPTFFAVGGDTVRIQNLNAGKLSFNVFGSPTDYDELVITENALTTRTIGSWRVVYTNGSYQLTGATVGAANTVFVGNGTSSAPSFRALVDNDIPDNITITETGDISAVTLGNGGTETPSGGTTGAVALNVVAGTSTGLAVNADSVYLVWTWLYGFVDTTTATIPRATLADSTTGGAARASLLIAGQGSANTFGRLNGDSLIVDTAFATRMNVTNLKVGSDAFITDITGDGLAISGGALIASLGQAIVTGEITDGTILWADLDSLLGVKQYVRAIYHDSIAADFGATMTITGNWVNTTNPWAVNEGGTGAATFTQNGILYGNGTSAIGVTAQGASGTVLHGNAGTPTFSAVVTGDITDGTIALADLGSNSVDSTKIVDGGIGSGDIGTGRILSSHILDGTIVTADIATGGVATADILDQTIATADLDSSDNFAMSQAEIYNILYCNQIQTESAGVAITIGGGAGLIVSSNVALGTDITDDSLVVEWNPEYPNMTLYRGGSTIDGAYMDSALFKIYGGSDSLNGNFIIFHDSILTTGNQRRHIALEIPIPDRVDSLRRVTVECISKQYTATSDEFFLVAKLLKAPVTWSSLDSLYVDSTGLSGNAHRLLDKDSSAAATLTTLHLNPPGSSNWTATPFGSFYLVLTGRRDAGSVFQWAKIHKIRMVYSRTRL